jgi:hypothetical protein
MKYFIFFFIFSITFLNVKAQSYNVQGDLALEEKDYQNARIWYSEGLANCNMYSIQKLTDIWKEQPQMRASMRLSMRKSYNCLVTLAEQHDQDAMLLISDYYKLGIGTEIDSVRAEHWLKEYGKSLGLSVETPPIDTVRIVDSSDINPEIIPQIPRKSILSNRFYSFLAYTYSLFEPIGATLGFYDKFGFYLSYRTNLNNVNYDYTCNNTNVPDIGIENPPYEFARERWKCDMAIGGIFIPVYKRKLFLSVGGGYAERNYFREIVSLSDQSFKNGEKSAWCRNTEASYEGWAAEIGGMWKWKRLIILGGVNSTKFRDLDGFLSVGYSF